MDGLSKKHIVYAHPVLLTHLQLFNMICTHSFVPNQFGADMIIPIINDKGGDWSSVHGLYGSTSCCKSD